MAIVHRAELRPSKLELLAEWLPTCAWYDGAEPIERVSAFRFDDPAGEVGIETFIIGSGELRFHVPLTYRAGPFDGGSLVGTLDHSVLGERWVYDAPSDPVYVDVVRDIIIRGLTDVDMVLDDGTPVPRLEWWGRAVGSGVEGPVPQDLTVARGVPAEAPAGAPHLAASWLDQPTPTAVAWLV